MERVIYSDQPQGLTPARVRTTTSASRPRGAAKGIMFAVPLSLVCWIFVYAFVRLLG